MPEWVFPVVCVAIAAGLVLVSNWPAWTENHVHQAVMATRWIREVPGVSAIHRWKCLRLVRRPYDCERDRVYSDVIELWKTDSEGESTKLLYSLPITREWRPMSITEVGISMKVCELIGRPGSA